jgi:hypothetical protein
MERTIFERIIAREIPATIEYEDADIIAFHKERNTVRVSVEQIPGGGWFPNPRYSTNWSQGGPIIEREGIGTAQAENGSDWVAMRRYTFQRDDAYWDGPTPLVAAMRCYVASKLGDSVDIPAAIAKATQET